MSNLPERSLDDRVQWLEHEMTELRAVIKNLEAVSVKRQNKQDGPLSENQVNKTEQECEIGAKTINPYASSLDERVLHLETEMEELPKVIQNLESASVKNQSDDCSSLSENQLNVTQTNDAVAEENDAVARRTEQRKKIIKNENILSKAGIGLLLFGIAFFFKYSFDQGWIGPEIRVLAAMCAGFAMLYSGHKSYDKKRNFSLVMTGGGIAVFYITAFSAFQILHLIPYSEAFLSMSAITALCYFLSVKQKEAVLSLVAMAGGFGTPFVLYSDSNNIPALVVYIVLLLTATGSIYAMRGWVSLLWTGLTGGLLVFLTVLQGVFLNSAVDSNDKIALQAGALFLCIGYSFLQPFRLLYVSKHHAEPLPDAISREISRQQAQVPLIILILAFFTSYISFNIWTFSSMVWGSIAAFVAMLYLLLSHVLADKERALPYFPLIVKLTGYLFLVAALVLFFSGDPFIFVMSGVAVIPHIFAAKMKSENLKGLGHLLMALLILWLTEYLSVSADEKVNQLRIGWASFELLWVIVLAFGISFVFDARSEKRAYRVIAHTCVLWWLYYVISPLVDGDVYVSLAWLFYSMILLVTSMRLNYEYVQQTAMSTLIILVIKLFLIDIEGPETTWRITLFLFTATGSGLAMLYSGHTLYDKKRNFSLVMTGGGIAVFYSTAFSAFETFHLVSYATVFLCMSAITALCFFMSVKQNETVLSLIAIAGGFVTPFVLNSDSNNIPALVLYIVLLLITAGSIYLIRGWASLFWTALSGGFLFFLIPALPGNFLQLAMDVNDKIALQAGVFLYCIGYSFLQPFRILNLSEHHGSTLPDAIAGEMLRQQPQIPLIILSLAFFTSCISLSIWTLPGTVSGSVLALVGILYLTSSLLLADKEDKVHHLPIILRLTSLLFFVAALVLSFSGSPLIFVISGIAFTLHILASRMKSVNIKGFAHLLFGIIALWLAGNLFVSTVDQFIIDWESLEVLWLIALAFGISFVFETQNEKRTYRVFAHMATLWLLHHVISPFSNGEAYVSIAWLLYAIILLIVSLRMDYEKVQQTAMSTLLILVIKLFLIDLAELETIWRITLFIFAGTIFLLLSYYFRSLSRQKQDVPALDE